MTEMRQKIRAGIIEELSKAEYTSSRSGEPRKLMRHHIEGLESTVFRLITEFAARATGLTHQELLTRLKFV